MARFLWITDTWSTLDHPKDSSLRLAEEAMLLKHECFWASYRSVRLRTQPGKQPEILVDAASLHKQSRRGIRPKNPRETNVLDFDQVHYRTDPPVDLNYLHPLMLLQLAASQSPASNRKFVNSPAAILRMNEKIQAADMAPPTLVSSQFDEHAKFGSHHGITVLKPLHDAASRGIEKLNWSTAQGRAKAQARIARLTEDYTRPCLQQKFLPEIRHGEIRLWFVDGMLLSHAKKLPALKDFRINMDHGSRLITHSLSPAQKKLARRIGASLKRDKIRLAAVDLIGPYVTDFNITSPGLIVQMEDLSGQNLAATIIQKLTKHI